MNPYEYSSLVICKQCYKPDAKRCSVCGSPAATSDGKTLYPGARCIGKDINKVDQYRCAFCNKQPVSTQSDAQWYYNGVYQWMQLNFKSMTGIDLCFTQPPFHLVPRHVLQEKERSIVEGLKREAVDNPAPSDLHGLCVTEQSDGIIKNSIYTETYLSPVRLRTNMVHELTHAWQYEQKILPPKVPSNKDEMETYQKKLRLYLSYSEGFAEWVTYKYIQWFITTNDPGKDEANRYRELREKNNDEIYGTGLRLFLLKEQQGKIADALSILTSKFRVQ